MIIIDDSDDDVVFLKSVFPNDKDNDIDKRMVCRIFVPNTAKLKLQGSDSIDKSSTHRDGISAVSDETQGEEKLTKNHISKPMYEGFVSPMLKEFLRSDHVDLDSSSSPGVSSCISRSCGINIESHSSNAISDCHSLSGAENLEFNNDLSESGNLILNKVFSLVEKPKPRPKLPLFSVLKSDDPILMKRKPFSCDASKLKSIKRSPTKNSFFTFPAKDTNEICDYKLTDRSKIEMDTLDCNSVDTEATEDAILNPYVLLERMDFSKYMKRKSTEVVINSYKRQRLSRQRTNIDKVNSRNLNECIAIASNCDAETTECASVDSEATEGAIINPYVVLERIDVPQHIRTSVNRIFSLTNEKKPSNVLEDETLIETDHVHVNDPIYCYICKKFFNDVCSKHPIDWICNLIVECPFITYKFDNTMSVSQSSMKCACYHNELEHILCQLPSQFILKESTSSYLGIWTKVRLRRGTIIGPYLGEVIRTRKEFERSRAYYSPKKTRYSTEKAMNFLNSSFRSNWMRSINVTDNPAIANLKFLDYDSKVFFQVKRSIFKNEELFVFEEKSMDKRKIKKEMTSKQVTGTRTVDSLKQFVPKSLRKRNGMRKTENIKSDHSIYKYKDDIKCIEKVEPEVKSLDKTKVNIDPEVNLFLNELLVKNPLLKVRNINHMIRTKFPNKPHVSDSDLRSIIQSYKISKQKAVDRYSEKELFRVFIDTYRSNCSKSVNIAEVLMPYLEFSQKIGEHPLLMMKDKSSETAAEGHFHAETVSITPAAEVKDELCKLAMEDIKSSPGKVFKDIKDKFPLQDNIFRVKFASSSSSRNPLPQTKVDYEMRKMIQKIQNENPNSSITFINQNLRTLLPNKPLVNNFTIMNVIQNVRSND